jgi:hypothetical protein
MLGLPLLLALALILFLGLPRWISLDHIGMIGIGPAGVHLEGDIATNANMNVRRERHTHLPGTPLIIEVKPATGVKIHIGRRIIPVVMLRPTPMGRRPRWGSFLIDRGAGGRGRRIAYDDYASRAPQYHPKHAHQQGSYYRVSFLHRIPSSEIEVYYRFVLMRNVMQYQCHVTKNRQNIKAYQQKNIDSCSRFTRHQYGGFRNSKRAILAVDEV